MGRIHDRGILDVLIVRREERQTGARLSRDTLTRLLESVDSLPPLKEESGKDDSQRHQFAVNDEIPSVTAPGPTDLYLHLLAQALTRALFEDSDRIVGIPTKDRAKTWVRLLDRLAPALGKAQIEVSIKQPYSPSRRETGRDWPARAETMCGLKRLANARNCIEQVLSDKIPGDIIETGVWRGGMSIFMRGVLKAYGVTDRTVWLADSFEGLACPRRGALPHRPRIWTSATGRFCRSEWSRFATTSSDTVFWMIRSSSLSAGSETH